MEYTVFYEHEDSYSSALFDAGCVGEALDHFLSSYSQKPVAWSTERTVTHGGHRLTGSLRRESLLAGRLIEKTPSGWVALGAEKQEEESELRWAEANAANPKNLIKRFTRVVDKPEVVGMSLSVAVAVIQSTPQFIGDGCWADAAMIARDGPARSALFLPAIVFGIDFAAVFPPAAAVAKPNPFPTTLRSPDCDSGPSDHLNASRHQMAGMSKS